MKKRMSAGGLVVLSLTLVLLGCGNDDENHADSALLGTWQLSSVRDPGGAVSEPDKDYTLTFNSQAAEGGPKGWQAFELFDGCNSCFGTYSAKGQSVDSAFADCTDVFCNPQPLMTDLLHNQVEGRSDYTVTGPILSLVTEDSHTLNFIDPERLPAGFVVLDAGYYTGIGEPRQEVIDNNGDFSALWNEHCGWQGPSCGENLPAVDFEQFSVVAVFLGERLSGGYTIRVDSLLPGIQETVAKIVETRPGPHCVVTLAITRPYQIVRIPKPEGSVVFQSSVVSKNCD